MSSKIVSVHFDRKKFTSEEARKWLREHGHTAAKHVHKNDKYLMYRLYKDPAKTFKRIRSKKVSNGKIVLYFGFPN